MLKSTACLSLLILVGCSEESGNPPELPGVSLQLSPTSDTEVLSLVLRNNSAVDLWLDSRGFFYTSVYDERGTSLGVPAAPPPPYDPAKHRYHLAAGEELAYERDISGYIEIHADDRDGFFVQCGYHEQNSGDPSIFSQGIYSNYVWVEFP